MRRPDWPERLAELLEVSRTKPFIWGQHDCVQFALSVLKAVDARDWSQISHTPYRSARKAKRVLQEMGFESAQELAQAVLGPAYTPLSEAKRGDLAAVPTPFGPALGVVVGAQVAAPGKSGLVLTPLTQALACWRI